MYDLEAIRLYTVSIHSFNNATVCVGYVYVPDRCREPGHQCRLHVSFHGCAANVDSLGLAFIENSGILPAARAQDVVVLFPQVEKQQSFY
jgi:hypothetical protein